MNTTAKSVWTQEDEARLLELQSRKERIMAENRAPVVAIAVGLISSIKLETCGVDDPDETLAGEMISDAMRIREALKPFDRSAS